MMMATKRGSLSFITENYYYVLVLLVALGILAACDSPNIVAWFGGEHSIRLALLKELGLGVITAIALIFTIEKVSHVRHQAAADSLIERINEDLFKAIYRRSIPDAIFSEVEKSLLRADVCRNDLRVVYTFEGLERVIARQAPALPVAPETAEAFLSCTFQSTYEIQNITDFEVSHPITVLLERPMEAALEQFCEVQEIKINGNPIPQAVLAQKTEKTGAHIRFTFNVHIPPKGKIDVATCSRLIKRKTDNESWVFLLPTNGFSLNINMLDHDYDVQASANHSSELDAIVTVGRSRSWRLNHGIFPHQSVVFWWKAQ